MTIRRRRTGLLTERQVAYRLRVPEWVARYLIHVGQIDGFALPASGQRARWRVTTSALEVFIARTGEQKRISHKVKRHKVSRPGRKHYGKAAKVQYTTMPTPAERPDSELPKSAAFEALRERIARKMPPGPRPTGVDLLRKAREERMRELTGG